MSENSELLFNNLETTTPEVPAAIEAAIQPLAWKLAPQGFDDYVGQEHLIGKNKPLRKLIENDELISLILWGNPGCGKTALSRLISYHSKASYISLNAVTAKVADIKAAIDQARQNLQKANKTILFIDEIHRFNKLQQDALLPDVEKGIITLIGATTENPFFSVIPGLISRSQIFELKPLSPEQLNTIALRAEQHLLSGTDDDTLFEPKAIALLIQQAQGDARKLINLIEMASQLHTPGKSISQPDIESIMQQSGRGYNQDDHYDVASALIKSLRGSDVNAALYWLARMLHGGEPPEFVARRLIIFASEDVGNADPQALILATALLDAVRYIGMPEARINLSQVVTYLATAPKSNASYTAINQAMRTVQAGAMHPVPKHLRDSHYKGAKKMGFGKGYIYPHDNPDGIFKQTYLDASYQFYTPKDVGFEKIIKKRMDFLDEKRS